MWERGARHRSNGSEPYMLMRLRKPDSTEWYPTSDERDAELEVTKAILAERVAELEATEIALERAKAKKKSELLTDPQALLDYYERKFGPLDRENPARELPPSTLQAQCQSVNQEHECNFIMLNQKPG